MKPKKENKKGGAIVSLIVGIILCCWQSCASSGTWIICLEAKQKI